MGSENETSVNNGEAFLVADSKTKLVVCRWDAPVALSRMFIGGHAGNFRLHRNFAASINEIILCDEITENDDLCIRRYIAAAYGVRNISVPVDNPAETLRKLGINDYGVFNSVILVR